MEEDAVVMEVDNEEDNFVDMEGSDRNMLVKKRMQRGKYPHPVKARWSCATASRRG